MSFRGIFGLEEEQLRGNEVGDLVVDRGAEEDDALAQKARVEVVGAFTAARLFEDGGDQEQGHGDLHGGCDRWASGVICNWMVAYRTVRQLDRPT